MLANANAKDRKRIERTRSQNETGRKALAISQNVGYQLINLIVLHCVYSMFIIEVNKP